MTTNKKIGIEIRKLRKKKSLSAQELSELSGVTKTYITAVERGEMNISIKKLEMICFGLDCKFNFSIK